jgi:FtsP/CotA-like multicopper oxidase with cupredoxin domain
MTRLFHALAIAAAALSLLAWSGAPAGAQGYTAPEFAEPVTLSSVDGVLEVTLTARQGEARLDTASAPVKNALLFGYELIRGKASNGVTAEANSYPAPTLQVFPGERLIIRYENGLTGLTIRDFYDPKYTPVGESVPIYPAQMTESPINLHTHGLHVSPKGNSDNVLLHIPAGTSNTFAYDVPTDMPQGMYWYHPHLHTLTAAHVYYGLAGLLAIGRTDGSLPAVTDHAIPIRNMALQYNFVFDRAGPAPQFNNPYWSQSVSTLDLPQGDALAKGTYRPVLAPVNFQASAEGTQFATVWYSGPLSIGNERGRFQFIPANLQRFTATDGSDGDVPADPSLPDHLRDVQFTVNGQFQPTIRSMPEQTEIWVLANISDIAYLNLRLTETSTGRHQKFAIVGQDGNPSPAVRTPVEDGGTRLLIPPASRFVIAVTMPSECDLVLEIAELGDGQRAINAPGIVYTNDGTENPPGRLGSLTVAPQSVSYYDGFFYFPTQVLARATPGEGQGKTVAFEEGQALGAYTSFEDLSTVTPDLTRNILINGGFLNDLVNENEPKAFIYAFDSRAFPNVPLIQPRLDSVEEWAFTNHNNDEHPIHVHVNDFQVTAMFDPARGVLTGAQLQGVDNANVPAPNLGPQESVIQAGTMSIRTRFVDYAGLFVMHCHRLNHEDNGLMMLVNVVPAVSSYALSVPGAPGQDAKVRVLDGNGDKAIATVTPFPGYEGTVSVAMGDVDDDGIYDLVVGAGKGHAPEVAVYSGASKAGGQPFASELTRFSAFDATATGGVSVAAVQIDGLTTGDNIIVGSGPGAPSEVKVFGSVLRAVGESTEPFSTFAPYPGDSSGVTLAAGFVDFTTGRNSIVTAPGAGAPAEVKVFAFPLFTPVGEDGGGHDHGGGDRGFQPVTTASFKPFGDGYAGGVSLATGWLAGRLGGAERIVVGQLDGGVVKVFSSGSALDGGPAMYLHSAMAHPHADFREMASFSPFGDGGPISVATTSTTEGADLLVSGVSAADGSAKVLRFELVRPDDPATKLDASPLGQAATAQGQVALGGD